MYCHNVHCSWKYHVNWLFHSDDLHHYPCHQLHLEGCSVERKQYCVVYVEHSKHSTNITTIPNKQKASFVSRKLAHLVHVSQFGASFCVSKKFGTLASINCSVSIILLFKQLKMNKIITVIYGCAVNHTDCCNFVWLKSPST